MNLPPVLRQRYFDSNGDPLAGGKIYTYQSGTTTPQATYTDSGGLTANANPLILDSAGYATMWLNPELSYKFVLKDSNDVTIWTTDGVIGLLTSDSVGTASIQDEAVTTEKLEDDSVTADKLRDSVSTDADRAVTTNHIRNEAITFEKMATALVQLLTPRGVVQSYTGTTAPTGWLLCSGQTIGSATSGATSRANADTSDLYSHLWSAFANTELIIQDSSGSNTTRGASASADFAANKRLPLPDLRGRVVAGTDNMGGSTASRISATYFLNATTLGAAGGDDGVVLSTSQMPAHRHFVAGDIQSNATTLTASNQIAKTRDAANDFSYGLDGGGTATDATIGRTSQTGGTDGHKNMQPTIILNYIIKM